MYMGIILILQYVKYTFKILKTINDISQTNCVVYEHAFSINAIYSKDDLINSYR